MPDQTTITIRDWVGLGVAGILSLLFYDLRGISKKFMRKDVHDEICDLKLYAIKEDLAEIKSDVKELLKRK